MPKNKLLVLVRHGESIINALRPGPFWKNEEERRPYQHLTDEFVPLTKEGCKQSKKTGEKLREFYGNFDLVLYSSYSRTKETTNLILAAFIMKERLGMELRCTPILRERSTGVLFNLTEKEMKEKYPEWQNYWNASKPLELEPPGGESIRAMRDGRVKTFYQDLLNYFDCESIKSILIVSHGRTIITLRSLLEKWSNARINQELRSRGGDNCSVTEYSCCKLKAAWKFSLKRKNLIYY